VTFDIIALCRRQPDPPTTLAAMLEAGPDLRVNIVDESRLVQLFHPDGRLLVTMEGSRLVQVPGEVQRILGVEVEIPVWWVECRVPGHDQEAEAVARRFTRALLAVTGGSLWSSR
jgi:hypothetical protein